MDLVAAMCQRATYPHDIEDVIVVETHMSWVFLTGQFAYKVKKPVDFGFADFTTLSRRHHFCEEELRCNRAFAPDLYLDVVALVVRGDGLRVVGADAAARDAVEDYAVMMRQFEPAQQADRLLDAGALSEAHMHQFGLRLAEQHTRLERWDGRYEPSEPIRANFAALRHADALGGRAAGLQALEDHAESQLTRWTPRLTERARTGFVRECHGDLHLSNLARLNDRLTAFDCLEFDPALRNVDVYADAAFLVMDLCVRGAEPLAYAFLDGYLDQSGDYEGAPLLPLFAEYRSVVRAKVAALRHAQTQAESDVAKLRRHLDWASQRLERGSGALWVTCGLSGSGKSYWGAQLVAPLQALRLRSDVLRKATHGLARDADSQSGIGAGMYSPDSSGAVYAQLAAIAEDLLSQGENVLIDAACLTRAQRAVFSEMAARVGACCAVLYFTAPQEVLRKRIDARRTEGRDPSEADTGVLAWQLERLEVPGPDEPTIVVETEGLELADVLARL